MSTIKKNYGKLDYLNLLMLLSGVEKLREQVVAVDKRATCQVKKDKSGVQLIMKNGFHNYLQKSYEPLLFL